MARATPEELTRTSGIINKLIQLDNASPHGVKESDFVTYEATGRHYDSIIKFSQDRWTELQDGSGGTKWKSRIHKNTEDRNKELKRNIFTGQACEWGLNEFVGTGLVGYESHRMTMAMNPMQSDGGADAPNLPYDVKGSFWDLERGQKISRNFHLWVRPGEYREGWFYILAVLFSGWNHKHKYLKVGLLGWATSDDLVRTTDSKGGEVYERTLEHLRPMEFLPHFPVIAQLDQMALDMGMTCQ